MNNQSFIPSDMQPKKEKNNKGIIAFLVIIIICLIGYIIFDKVSNKEDKSTNTSTELKYTKILYESDKDSDNKHKVGLVGDKLYIDDKEQDNGISSYKEITLGGDVCHGNTYIVFLKTDKSISSLSIDSLECGNTIKYNKDLANLKNVTKVYSKVTSTATEYEPEFKDIYIDTETASEIKITSIVTGESTELKDEEILYESYDKDYVVTIKNENIYINDKLKDNNVKEYIKITKGSELCEGDTYLVFLKSNGTISSISIDKMVCGGVINYKPNINNIKGATKLYLKDKNVLVDTATEQGIDITDNL